MSMEPHGKRKRGRPRVRRMDAVNGDMQVVGLARKMAGDRIR